MPEGDTTYRTAYVCPNCQAVTQASTRTPGTSATETRARGASSPGGADIPASRPPPTGDGDAP